MSELPPGWEWTTIGEIAEVNPAMSKADLTDDQIVSFVPMVAVAEESGLVDLSDTRTAGSLKNKSYRQFVDGDLLVAKITPSMENGKAAVARELMNGRGFGSTEFHVVRASPAVLPEYLLHFVLQRGFRADAARNMTGTAGQLRVPPDYLRSRPVPLPPRGEQERIVAAIEEHLSRLEAAKAATASARRRIAGFYDSVLQETFDPAWPRDPLDSLNDPERPICYGILKPKTPEPGTVPYVEVRSIAKGRIKMGELHKTTSALHQEFRRSELRPGDVTLAIRGSFDRAAVVPQELVGANVSRDVARIAPTHRLLPDFLAAFLVSPEARRFFRSHARGVAVQGINIGDLRRLPVPSPDLERQQAAIRQIEAARAAIDHIEDEVRVGEVRSRQLRHSILAAAFSGELVRPDANDQPASVALEHTCAEQTAATPTKRTRKAKAS
jgi:type I restriction enzyme S subunit